MLSFLSRRSLEETPLMTKALKESQLKEKMDRYPKVPAPDYLY